MDLNDALWRRPGLWLAQECPPDEIGRVQPFGTEWRWNRHWPGGRQVIAMAVIVSIRDLPRVADRRRRRCRRPVVAKRRLEGSMVVVQQIGKGIAEAESNLEDGIFVRRED